jgi:hypothetical protein
VIDEASGKVDHSLRFVSGKNRSEYEYSRR